MFTPLASFTGGLLLSYSTSSLLIGQGRTLGCSGVAHGVVSSLLDRRLQGKPALRDDKVDKGSKQPSEGGNWRTAVLAGLVGGGFLLRQVQPVLEYLIGATLFDPAVSGGSGWKRTMLAGLFVGVGTKLANGCTSGHMLLGLARLSVRSLVATLTFFLTAFLTSLFFPLSFITLLTSPPSSPLILARIPVRAALTLVYLPVLFVLASGVRAPFFAELPPSIRPRQSTIQAFSCGVVFTFGLALAGMTRPSKVLSFFYIPLPASLSGVLPAAPAVWDPSLAMVALGGLLPNMVVWQKIKGWEKPSKGEKWEVPRGGKVDAKLVAGAALFGVGWGLSGICPGPLFAVLGAHPTLSLLLFASSFVVGGQVARRL